MLRRIVALAYLFLCADLALASDYKLEFTATDLVRTYGSSSNAPTAIAGYFVFSGNSPMDALSSLKEVSLTLGDLAFSLADVETEISYDGKWISIGGKSCGVNQILCNTTDFYLSAQLVGGSNTIFSHTTADPYTSWISGNASATYTEVTPVPEPEVYTMLLVGIGLIGFAARRRVA